jgi:taurine dioxygenase
VPFGSGTSILKGLENKPEVAKQYWQELFEKILDFTPVYAHI